MSRLDLAFLGNPEIKHDQRPLSFRTRKGLALLVYLAVAEGMHTRAHIAALLWPESDAAAGRANLRSTLMYLRKTLGHDEPAADHLLVERKALGFNRDASYQLDLDVVQRALDNDPPITTLQQAVATGRGEFMAGFSLSDAVAFDDWLTLQREQWHLRLNDCFNQLARRLLDRGQLAAAGATLQQWLAFNPLEERAYRRLMRAQYQQGNRSGALQTFARCRDVLESKLGIPPAAATAVLAERIRAAAETSGAPTAGGATGSHLVIPLVGRAPEHKTLSAALRQARGGQTQLLLIEGEAGMGKTRLAHEFMGWAEARYAVTLAGRAYETGGRLPYQPIMDALRPAVDVQLAPTWLAELSRLLPQLRERHPDLPPPMAETEAVATRLFEAVAQLGMALAARQPVVLLIDDVQWADASSLDLLLYASRRWTEEKTPLLLLLTLRSEALVQVSAAMKTLRQWLVSVQQGIDSQRIQLTALSASAVAEMIGALARRGGEGEAFAYWLFAETEGHPFYVMAMLEALLEEGVIKLVPAGAGAPQLDISAVPMAIAGKGSFIPPGVRELIHHRLSQLTDRAFNLLAAAAVMGQAVTFRQLCQVTGQAELAGLAALDELIGARLLVSAAEEKGSAGYQFTHDKIRDVVYTEAGDARRQLFHERAFDHLQAAGAPPARLAHHATAAGLARPAFTAYLAAGNEAMDLFATRDAIEFYERARQVWQEEATVTPTAGQIQQLYQRLGRAYELVNRWPAADDAYQALLQYAHQEARPELEVAALSRRAEVAFRGRWQSDQAVAHLEAAQAIAEAEQDQAGLVKINTTLSQVVLYEFDREKALHHAKSALALARELGDELLIARSLNVLVYARFGLPGTLSQVEVEAAEARGLFAKAGNLALEADSLVMVAHTQTHQGRPQEAVANLRQARAIVRQIENSWGQVNVAFHLAFALVETGELDEALATIEEGVVVAQRHKHDVLLANVYSVRGTVRRARGELAQARADHAAAQRRFAHSPFSLLPAITAVHLCADCALAGVWDAAHEYARQALAVEDVTWLWVWSDAGFYYQHVVAALWRAGDEAAAHTALARLEAAVGDNPRYRRIYREARALIDG